MRRSSFLFLLLPVLLWACATVPITGRPQLSLVSSESLFPLSFNQYSEFLSTHKVIEGTPEAQTVQRVGARIQHAVEQYLARNNMLDRLKGYQWEFRLVDDPKANAFAMPGGKVAVFSGILPIAGGEAGLATVMGHEIAHDVAHHGEERMSQGLAAELGGAALGIALAQKPEQTRNLFMTAFGVGTQVGVLLPYSRVQESEADHLGLIFMAMAGYDPREAVGFWQRMTASQGGGGMPEILSSHPADANRIKNLEKLLPEAMKYYRR